MRAVIDVGTNSVLLLLAERDGKGRVQVHSDRVTITRLGKGVAKTRVLEADAIERTLEALREYRAIAEEHGAPMQVVATEAVRMVRNPEAFLVPAKKVLGQRVRLISGDEEAQLSYRSVALEYPDRDEPLRVIDIGGASTELVAGVGPDVLDSCSHPVGSVRLTEQCISGDPPPLAQIAMVAQAAREAFAEQLLAPRPELYGLAGTVTSVAALLLGLEEYDREKVDDSRWTAEQIETLRNKLAVQTTEQRARTPILEGRADVIVAGVTILLEAMRHCGANTLVVRDRGLRYALI